ncbi:receptor protein-tyrosine kinase [Arsukibacterium tuosuense]|uniref:non-specific protein-tyrosine kinase n=1 Tax=Arsukibacterium tuosuense TaxID=1323745 RepID=A0A285IUA8_9GAMM|nr:XrtA-associated tyrosine autokinase [Arsukibacterium tuosuense]SNY51568.1 receptor protein-tyrosine kinase [Arsukibacterium tuosuense]
MSTIEKAVTKLNRDSTGQAENNRQKNSPQMQADEPGISQQGAGQEQSFNQDASSHLVQLDLALLEKKNFVSLSKDRRLINEEYRVIKRKLINNAFGVLSKTLQHPNLILVSSSRPGEGKTFSAINLALSIALEQDKTVLLVDADVLRPNVSKTLNISHNLGLTDYLQSPDVTVPDILLSTNVERLKIITAGSPHHLSTELLASERMSQLVNEFATRYSDRIVIFDAPPLLGVNETAVMAAMCGQAVVVVEENRTRLAEIEQSVSLLPKEMAVGFLINKAHRNQGKGYGYGYYYGAS